MASTQHRPQELERIAPLVMWVVYDHPKDYPRDYVARQFFAGANIILATDETITAGDLDTLRRVLESKGLVKIERAMSDDPVIVETWL